MNGADVKKCVNAIFECMYDGKEILSLVFQIHDFPFLFASCEVVYTFILPLILPFILPFIFLIHSFVFLHLLNGIQRERKEGKMMGKS